MNNYLSPEEIATYTVELGVKKANKKWYKQIILGIMAGIFIALASNGSSVASYGIVPMGLGKAMAGALFGTGLMLVVIAGADLFTGNCLIMMSVLEKRTRVLKMLLNWLCVYIGNFIGSAFIALMIFNSSQLNMDEGMMGAYTIKTAVAKCSFSFKEAFIMGVLCNILVCLAVWMAYGAKDISGKVLGIFFPIWLFITAGFEHSVANMYYITAGLLAKGNETFVKVAESSFHVTPEKLSHLTVENFLVGNLLPVTLGNIVGGAVLVGGIYWFLYVRKH